MSGAESQKSAVGNNPGAAPVTGTSRVLNAVPPHVFIVGSGLIQYVGAAIAVALFAVMLPAEVAW